MATKQRERDRLDKEIARIGNELRGGGKIGNIRSSTTRPAAVVEEHRQRITISASSWRSCKRRAKAWIKQNALRVDLGAARFEIFLQLRRVEGVVVFPIQFEPDLAASV